VWVTVARRILACSTALALLPAAAARADTRCAEVQTSHGLSGAWLDAARELERQLAQLTTAECQTATLIIEPFDGEARIVATRADGRRAERIVRRPESMVATGLGLVMAVPQPDVAPASIPAPSPTASASSGSPAPAAAPSVLSPPQPPPPSVARPLVAVPLGLWLGFDVGGRTSVPATIAAADVSAHADILLDHWIFQVTIRSSPVGFTPGQRFDNDAYREVNVGLGAGRRFSSGDTSFDMMIAPSIAAMRIEWDYADGQEAEGEDVEFAINASARIAFSLSRDWALTLTVESELVPGNLTSSAAHLEPPANLPASDAGPPSFPAWLGSVRFGAMGAVL